MDTLATTAVTSPDGAEPADHDVVAAKRYIEAIVCREPIGSALNDHVELRRQHLWQRFLAEYRSATTGPYSRRDGAALRLALGRI